MSTRDVVRAIQARLSLVATLLLVAFAYRAALRVYFISDDFTRLLAVTNSGPWVFLLDTLSGHPQLMDNAVFLLWYRIWGFHALAWAILNLATHLLNTFLLFELVRKITKSRTLAALAGAMWGTSILHSETMSWFANYGHVMIGVILLIVLNQLVTYLEDSKPVPATVAAWWAFLLWIASTCWGIGIAFALVFPVALAVASPRMYRQRAIQVAFGCLPVAVVGWYFAARWIRNQISDIGFGAGSIVGQAFANFGPPKVLFWHLLRAVADVLIANYWAPLERYPVSGPAWIIPFVLLAAAAVVIVFDSRTRRLSAALALLLVSGYALIALGRANTIVMWNASLSDAGAGSRYHYTGSLLLTIILMIGLARAATLARRPRALPAVALGVWAASWLYSRSLTDWRLDERKNCRETAEPRLAAIDARIDAAPKGRVYLPLAAEPLGFVCGQWNFDLWPGDAALFAIKYPTNDVRGRSVRFIAPPEKEEVLDRKEFFADPKNRRTSTLIVSAKYVELRPGTVVAR